jgi:hypothetical protein
MADGTGVYQLVETVKLTQDIYKQIQDNQKQIQESLKATQHQFQDFHARFVEEM